jgi:hypothetical protein
MGLQKFKAPVLPVPPKSYDQQYMTQLVRILGNYFNLLDSKSPVELDTLRLVALPTDYVDLREGEAFRLPTEGIVRIVVDGVTPAAAATQVDLDALDAELTAEIATKVAKAGDTMTGTLVVPSVVIGAFTIQEVAGKLTFSVAGNAIASLDTLGNFTALNNVTGFGTP